MPIADIANGETGASARAKINAAKALAEALDAAISAYGETLVGAANDAAARILLGLVINTNVQAYRLELTKLGVQGADIVASATLDLEGASGRFCAVTGNTPITSITLSAGHTAIVRFYGQPTIAWAVLDGNAGNLQINAGDFGIFEGVGGSAVRGMIIRGNGKPTVMPSFGDLGLGTIASQAATAVNIDGGTIDGTVIGGAARAAASVTNLTAEAGSASANALHSTAGATAGINFPDSESVAFASVSAEVARVVNGSFLIGKTVAGLSTTGVQVGVGGTLAATAASVVATFNRTGDGVIVNFASADSTKATISISGETGTFNSFCGAHWSQWQMLPEIIPPVGTVVSTVDELCVWKALEWQETVPAVTRPVMRQVDVVERREVMRTKPVYVGRGKRRQPTGEMREVGTGEFEDVVVGQTWEDTGEIEVVTPEQTVRGYRLYDGPAPVGATVEVVGENTGATIEATVVAEVNTTLPKVKVSDEDMDPRVYGVRSSTDSDGDESIASLGVHPVRVRAGEAIANGDLLVSAGNGCLRVLDPDTPMTARVHASIVAKVTCTIPCLIHMDGSFNVPASLHCG